MPVRKIPPKHLGLTGVLRGRNGDRIAFESSLERDFIQLMLFDPKVMSVEEQPVCISVPNGIGFGKTYVPDFLVSYEKESPRLIEVKPSDELHVNKDRFADRFRAAEDYAGSRGWSFEVWTEQEIRVPRLSCAQFLLPFREQTSDPAISAQLCALLSDARRPMPVSRTLESYREDPAQYGAALRAVWCLLADGTFRAEFDGPIGLETNIWFQRRAL